MAGINPVLAAEVVDELMQGVPKAMELVERSFLSSEAKRKYKYILDERHRSLGLK
jgi:serine/threonine-protein kinase HipA